MRAIRRTTLLLLVYIALEGLLSRGALGQAEAPITVIQVGPPLDRAAAGAVAVNPSTNRIYLARRGGLYVVDGTTYTSTPIGRPGELYGIVAVNPVTGLIYVLRGVPAPGGSLEVIDGETHATHATIALPTTADDIVINPLTNRIYLLNSSAQVIVVVDGETNTVMRGIGTAASRLAVNPTTNTLYGVSLMSIVTIDGGTNMVTGTHSLGELGVVGAITVDAATNRIYALVSGRNVPAPVLDEGEARAGPAAIDSQADNTALVTIDAATMQAVATSPLGPWGRASIAAVDPAANIVYALTGYNLLAIDVADGRLLDRLWVSVSPSALALDPIANRLYLPMGMGRLLAIDAAHLARSSSAAAGTRSTRVTGTLPVDFFPGGVAVNAATGDAYVRADRGPSGAEAAPLLAIDGATSRVTATISHAIQPTALAVNPVANTVYLGGALDPADGGDPAVLAIDGATRRVTGTVRLPGSLRQSDIAVDPARNILYVTGGNGADGFGVIAIDAATHAVIAIIPFAQPPYLLAVNAETNTIYAVNTRGLFAIDGTTHRVTAEVQLAVRVSALTVNPVSNTIYAVAANQVFAIDGATHRITATLDLGYPFNGVAVDPVANLVYVTGGQTLTVLDGATLAIRDFVTLGNFVFAIAVDPRTGAVYAISPHGRFVAIIRTFRP